MMGSAVHVAVHFRAHTLSAVLFPCHQLLCVVCVCVVCSQAAEAAEVAKLLEEARSVPKGARKPVGRDMYKAYHPQMVEAAWYDW